MKYGISIPNGGAFGDVRDICALAREAEDAGWDGFFLWDHMNAFPGPIFDPWVTLAAIAAATEGIRIGTMITPLARRRPWVVARQAATLDHLSNGRVILGVGLGYPPREEFEAFGEDADDRVRAEKLDEALAIIDGLWTGATFSFSGKHHRIDEVRFEPKPVQQPRIPIWVAGVWPATRAPFRRAARYDGVFPINFDDSGPPTWLTPQDARDVVAYVNGHRTDASAPYDVVVGGPMPPDITPFEEAGVTWWMESGPDAADLRSYLGKLPRH